RSAYLDGVSALTDRACSGQAGPWERSACGSWSAAELIQHVAAVAGWYHEWLDRALAGRTDRPFAARDIHERNDEAMGRFATVSGPDAVAEFDGVARSYVDRAAAHWDVPYAYPFGVVTAGLHLGVAAAEWHLHAWDLDRSHVPADPEGLFLAAGTC